jgi:hypothetical protein
MPPPAPGCPERIFLYAFDLIELNGDDLRPDPLEGRKATLEMILAKAGAASGSTSTWKATARPCFGTLASLASRSCGTLCRLPCYAATLETAMAAFVKGWRRE